MKQLFQSYKTGQLELAEVPVSKPGPNNLLVETRTSLVSVGTEKYMLELAKKSLLGKAIARPDLVRQVIHKVRTEGLEETYRQVMGRLDTPMPLGYSSAGVVLEAGRDVKGFSAGDRVACSGSGFASHAEIVSVPVNFCARIPDNVSFDSASFVALGGIALEAFRLARAGLGETVAVIGLGLLGQLAVQLARSAGCHVLGLDLVPEKVALALEMGCDVATTDFAALESAVRERTRGNGVDSVLIFAASASNTPLEQAAQLCRERGRVVAAGLVGLEIPRTPFFDKELELVVSRAWGPGIFDPLYIEKGVDYPLPYARWTAGRNLAECLVQIGRGTLQVDRLITHRFSIEKALEAYDLILSGREPCIGVLLTYPGTQSADTTAGKTLGRRVELGQGADPAVSLKRSKAGALSLGLIGAGQFAKGTLLPALQRVGGIEFRGLCTASGLKGRHTGEQFGFDYCTTEAREVLQDAGIDLVAILTRHGTHARYVVEALKAGKHVFVEKPLALSAGELETVVETWEQANRNASEGSGLAVLAGFNRRFSPSAVWLKGRFSSVQEPLAVHCTVNAGFVPADSWVHDPEQGGGRVIGEVCHFVDLIQFFTGAVPVRVSAESLTSQAYQPSDNVAITVKMSNGAIGSILYVAGGDKSYPRERIEVVGGGAVGTIENFQAAAFTRQGRKATQKSWRGVDRGHRAEMTALVEAIRAGKPSPVNFEEHVYTTLATFAIEKSLQTAQSVEVGSRGLFSEGGGRQNRQRISA